MSFSLVFESVSWPCISFSMLLSEQWYRDVFLSTESISSTTRKKKGVHKYAKPLFLQDEIAHLHSDIAKTTYQPFVLWYLFNVLQSERLQGRRIIWEMILCYFKYGVGLTFLDPCYVHHTSLLLSSG